MLFGKAWEVSLERGWPGLGLHSGSGGVPPLGALFPSPHPVHLSKHVVRTSVMLANVPQQWVSSSQLASSAQPDPSLVPASWSALWKSAWARVPIPDTCCFQARKVSHSRFVSYAPCFPIHAGLSPQPLSLLPSMAAQALPQPPLHVPTLADYQ